MADNVRRRSAKLGPVSLRGPWAVEGARKTATLRGRDRDGSNLKALLTRNWVSGLDAIGRRVSPSGGSPYVQQQQDRARRKMPISLCMSVMIEQRGWCVRQPYVQWPSAGGMWV